MCSTKSIHTNFTCNEILILFEKKKKGNSRYAAKLICSNIEPTQFFFIQKSQILFIAIGFFNASKALRCGENFLFQRHFFLFNIEFLLFTKNFISNFLLGAKKIII